MRSGAWWSRLRPWVTGGLALALLGEGAAWAQPGAPGAPTQIGDEERAAARAEALVHAPTHLLYIARTEAKLGQLVEASETYARIQHEALAPDAPKAFVD